MGKGVEILFLLHPVRTSPELSEPSALVRGIRVSGLGLDRDVVGNTHSYAESDRGAERGTQLPGQICYPDEAFSTYDTIRLAACSGCITLPRLI